MLDGVLHRVTIIFIAVSTLALVHFVAAVL